MQPDQRKPMILPRGTGHHALRRTIPLFLPYKWQLLASSIFVAFTGFTVSLMPLFTREVVDLLGGKARQQDLILRLARFLAAHCGLRQNLFTLSLLIMLGFVVAMLLRMASWYAGQLFLLFIREKIIFHLRSAVFTKLQELCMRFHQKYNPGFLFDRTLGGASVSVGTFLSMLFNNLVSNGAVLISSIIICLRLHVVMTVLMVGMSSGYIVISKMYGQRIYELSKDFNLAVNKFAGQVTDLLRGVKTIKAFAMEQRVISEFDEQLWPLQLRSLAVNRQTMFLGFHVEGLSYLISAMVVVVCAYYVWKGQMSLGMLVAFTGYQGMVTGMMGSLSSVASTYGAATAGLEQMFEIIDEQPTVRERKGATMPKQIHGELELMDVSFAYDDRKVLENISFRVPAGQSVALVGPSGGGKSTLTNLLIRFYDPDSGSIRLDGVNIAELPLTGYRHLFGVVLQDPFLFNDTILNNLLAVKPEATEMELRDALERAQAWEFVAQCKNTWHFNVGESGGQLSGGQRQRIALARCFLTNPRIMILDEATSALDNQSELLVQRALQDIMRGRTVFIIAHRLSTVRNVDRVLVLQDGKIVQDGSYSELRDTPGLFRDLHLASLQAGEEDVAQKGIG